MSEKIQISGGNEQVQNYFQSQDSVFPTLKFIFTKIL